MSVSNRGVFIIVAFLITAPDGSARQLEKSSVKETLRDRCNAAITANDPAVKPHALKETLAMESTAGNYLFELKQADGGRFVCQVCDEKNPAIDCGTLGLRLGHQPAGGDMRDLPAELDRKCAYYLQKELKRSMTIDRAMVERIRTTEDHTDKSWLFMMNLDANEYRCVVRKSDGNFRVEAKKGDTWRPIAAGILF